MVYTENKTVKFDTVTISNGYACYVSGEGDLVYHMEVQDVCSFMAKVLIRASSKSAGTFDKKR